MIVDEEIKRRAQTIGLDLTKNKKIKNFSEFCINESNDLNTLTPFKIIIDKDKVIDKVK